MWKALTLPQLTCPAHYHNTKYSKQLFINKQYQKHNLITKAVAQTTQSQQGKPTENKTKEKVREGMRYGDVLEGKVFTYTLTELIKTSTLYPSIEYNPHFYHREAVSRYNLKLLPARKYNERHQSELTPTKQTSVERYDLLGLWDVHSSLLPALTSTQVHQSLLGLMISSAYIYRLAVAGMRPETTD